MEPIEKLGSREKSMILSQFASCACSQSAVPEDIYRNKLKNRESDKASSQPRLLHLLCSSKVHWTFKESSQPENLYLEQAIIVRGQGASENANFEATTTTSETDSSACFGMLLVSRTREQGGKMAQKGDFTGFWSFNWLNGFNV